jgi:glycosyltransferase involved in cell wall biosynthesis
LEIVRIAYDHRIFSFQRYGGVSRYFHEVATRMAGLAGCEVEVLAWAHVNEYLRQSRPSVVRGRYVPELRRTGALRRAVNDHLTRRRLRQHPADILHESYYAARGLAPEGTTTVLSVFDMIHEKFPGMVSPTDPTAWAKARAVERADHIICISESTRRDLLEVLGVPASKVSVVHLGCSPGDGTESAKAPRVTGPYLLYVGSRGGYKNFDNLLRAFASTPALHSHLRLVCFGGGPLSREEEATIAALRLERSRIIQLAGDDRDLANLYSHTHALVYPSLYEGFGIPPLEAMAHGCPVVCSNASSLPEVVGDAAELFDPTDVPSIATAIERVVCSSGRAESLRARGRERAEHFSWDRCARETHAVYRSLL